MMTVRRDSIRYPGYDYRQPRWYFLTINTYARQQLFGRVNNATVHLSPVGEEVNSSCRQIESQFPGVEVDTCVVMPDHMHIILFLGTDPELPATHAIPEIVGWLKNRLQALYRYRVAEGVWPPYRGRLWQSSYHDRIIRNDRELEAYRAYIEGNPGRWQERRQP